MTDDELFTLANRIHRIESSMISFHSTIKNALIRREILTRLYEDLTSLPAQLDTALGLGDADQNADIADNPPQPSTYSTAF